ncbi:ribosome-binding protein 1 [Limosa lapponica baueri]|uniref:Ribosome-binding protein 1 n=1 Tax=Limosa lapponica baueri TaxID=1758121 RepID=A0A2I0T7G1_LIMLA|nr:ribosome-binding protein 1 [Limosa lapponica baueri]
MDVYDPQTLGVMVFGGFMVISAIGIFLVSTFSMKETSYEEALAKQRKELEKTQQQKIEKKKKEKPVEKKGKAKKKEEKPNGKIPEQQLTQEVTDSPKDVVLEPAVVPEPVTLAQLLLGIIPLMEDGGRVVGPVVEPGRGDSWLKKQMCVMRVFSSPSHIAFNYKAPADSDGPLYLPYKTLVSTVSSMVFSEGEAQQLIEILTEKAGIVQDTWHTATQKGDPVAVLKRQLEEKEKQLAAEQEDVAAARNKLRELSKIRTLQEQLENGPNTQLARLQQENSILRDALNQATSQTESK